MRIQPFINRLQGTGFNTVGGALEFAALSDAPGRGRSLYIVPGEESASASDMVGVIDQKIVEMIDIVLMIPAIRQNGTQISDDFEAMKEAVIDRIVGWVHPDGGRPFQRHSGRTMSVDGGVFAYVIRFTTSHHYRKAG